MIYPPAPLGVNEACGNVRWFMPPPVSSPGGPGTAVTGGAHCPDPALGRGGLAHFLNTLLDILGPTFESQNGQLNPQMNNLDPKMSNLNPKITNLDTKMNNLDTHINLYQQLRTSMK